MSDHGSVGRALFSRLLTPGRWCLAFGLELRRGRSDFYPVPLLSVAPMMLAFLIAWLAVAVPVPGELQEVPAASDPGLIDSNQVLGDASEHQHGRQVEPIDGLLSDVGISDVGISDVGISDPVLPLIDTTIERQEIASWSATQVGAWAAAQSPRAAMINTERRAVGCGLNRRDARQCAQVGLTQATLAHIEQHERNRSAAEALEVYFQGAGLQRQSHLLLSASHTLDSLIDLAQRSSELGLPGVDPDRFRQQRLELQDQVTRATFGAKKLRLSLAWMTGREESESISAELANEWLPDSGISDQEDPVSIALAHRHDLKAAETLCRCMSADSLPAARRLLGILQPGIGLAAAVSPGGLIGLMCKKDKSASDLACRRQQCRELQQSMREAIRSEVLIASLDLQEAGERLRLASDRRELAQRQLSRTESAIEIDQANVGEEMVARLALRELEGELIGRWIDHAVADVRLREAQGIIAE